MSSLSPISGNYIVGKGLIYFKKTGSIKWEELGDADGFANSQEVERLERYSNQYAVRTKTDTRIIQQNYTLNMTLFQLTARVRSMGLLSDIAYLTQTGATEATKVISGIETGGIYDLEKLNVTAITVTDGAGSPVSYSANTHYELDSEAGLLSIVSKPGSAGSNLHVFFSAAAIVATSERLNAGIGSSPNLEGSIRFRAVNDAGRAVMVQFHKVRIIPSGERQYISDEYSSVTIEGEALADSSQPTGFEIGYERDLNTTT